MANRYARRLVVAALTLAAVDVLVPGLVERSERAHYESSALARFESADLFAIGPLVAYLREHPRGTAPRTAFFGDSVVWGYGVPASQTVPAQFQRLVPAEHVLNFGVNGSGIGSAYLLCKAVIDSVDDIYVFDMPDRSAIHSLGSMIPVEDEDVKRFGLEPPHGLQHWLQMRLSFWNLYRDSDRLQAAWFGTSTRLYLYVYKTDLAQSAVQAVRRRAPPAPATAGNEEPSAGGIEASIDLADHMPDSARQAALSAAYVDEWAFAALVRAHHKRAIVLELDGHAPPISPTALGELNAVFHPSVRFVRLRVPAGLRLDGVHANPAGARALAHTLLELRTS